LMSTCHRGGCLMKSKKYSCITWALSSWFNAQPWPFLSCWIYFFLRMHLLSKLEMRSESPGVWPCAFGRRGRPQQRAFQLWISDAEVRICAAAVPANRSRGNWRVRRF
jgi:hypothetical protein